MWIGLRATIVRNDTKNTTGPELTWIDGKVEWSYYGSRIRTFLTYVREYYPPPRLYCVGINAIPTTPLLYTIEKRNCNDKKRFMCETEGWYSK